MGKTKNKLLRWLLTKFLVEAVDPLCEDNNELLDVSDNVPLKLNLQKLLAPYFNDVKIHFYGSRIVGAYTEDSDLDIFVEIGEKKIHC